MEFPYQDKFTQFPQGRLTDIRGSGWAIVEDGPHIKRGASFTYSEGDKVVATGVVTRRRRQPDGMVKVWLTS